MDWERLVIFPFPPLLTTVCLNVEKGHFSSNSHVGVTTLLTPVNTVDLEVVKPVFMCQGLLKSRPTLGTMTPVISDVPRLIVSPEGTLVTMSHTQFRR